MGKPESSNNSMNVGLIGCGDIIKKAAPAVKKMKEQGYRVVAADFIDDPVGLPVAEPDLFFNFGKKASHSEFLSLAFRERFRSIYVANPGNAHLPSTLELQHFTDQLIIAKPLDTNVGLISTIRESEQTNYLHLIPKIVIHDHYLNKPGVKFLMEIMPRLQSEFTFLDTIQMYLVERDSIEAGEPHRLEGLRCGMVFDLGVHLLSILRGLVPMGAKWEDKDDKEVICQRTDRSIRVTNCVTGRFGGTFLGKSTVVPDRRAETFGVVEFLVKERIVRSTGHELENEVRVLVVVGKGVPVDQYASRDLKAILLKFQAGREVVLDIDTHRFNGVDDSVLRDEGYYNLDLTQKGINEPLISAAESGFPPNGFQTWGPGARSVLRLYEGLVPAGRPIGYDHNRSCRDLVSMLIRDKGGFAQWDLPSDLNRLIIGAPIADAVP